MSRPNNATVSEGEKIPTASQFDNEKIPSASRNNSTVLENEKIEQYVQHIENGEKSDHDSHAGVNAEHMPDYRDRETRRILRKVDFRLIPLLTTLYVFSFLDRSNLVRVEGRAP